MEEEFVTTFTKFPTKKRHDTGKYPKLMITNTSYHEIH